MRHSNPLTWASGTTLATLAATAAAALTRDRDTGTLGRPGRNARVLDRGKRVRVVVRQSMGGAEWLAVSGWRSMGGRE